MATNKALEDVLGEFLLACERQEPIDEANWLHRYPEHAEELRAFFRDHQTLRRISDSASPSATPHGSASKPGMPPLPGAVAAPRRGAAGNDLASTCANLTSRPPLRAAIAPGGGPEQEAPTILPRESLIDDEDTISRQPMTFGPYELIDEIARGGMGVVYRARHRELNRIVALKMIQNGRFASRDEVERFHTEAGAVASLSHAGIVPLYEYGECEGWHYYTMELIEGRTLLDEAQQRNPFDFREAAVLVRQIASAIAHAHDRGIIHRDLKPANVLLDAKGSPRITDFGLAKRVDQQDELTASGQILGTASYMAPEQAAGTAQIDHRVDVYALGAILYWLCTGRPPFQAENQLDLLLRVLEGEPQLPRTLRKDIPKALSQICMKCLQRLPKNRYASAHQVAADLDHYLMGEPIEAAPPSPWSRIRRWSRRKPALATHVGGLAFIELFRHVRYLNESIGLPEDFRYHMTFTVLFAIWAGLSWVLQKLYDRPKFSRLARYLWIGLDVVMATIALSIVHGNVGMLLMSLALIIVGSGAFSRVSIVVWATIASTASLLFLLQVRPDLQSPAHYGPICVSFLAVFGVFVGVQVHRLKRLSERLGT